MHTAFILFARDLHNALVESFLLSFIGAALGLIVAQFGSKALLAQVSPSIRLDVAVNLQVLGFAISVEVLTAILFRLPPAFRSAAGGATLALRR